MTYLCPYCNSETEKYNAESGWIIWPEAGGHPLIKKYSEWLATAMAKAREMREEIEKARRAAVRPVARYGNATVKVFSEKETWSDVNLPIVEKVRITLYIQNEEELTADLHLWGSAPSWDKSKTSVSYYRTSEGILTYDGGGWSYILKTPQLISKEEWDKLKQGDVPERFLSK